MYIFLKKIYLFITIKTDFFLILVRAQTIAVSSARGWLQGPHVCIHAYISQTTITTINRSREQKGVKSASDHTPDSQGQGSGDEA